MGSDDYVMVPRWEARFAHWGRSGIYRDAMPDEAADMLINGVRTITIVENSGSINSGINPDLAKLIADAHNRDVMLSAAPPSPRSDDGSGLTPSEHGSSAIAQERDVGELVEDIDIAADELIDSVQYLQETMAAGEGVYESKWLGGVMSAHEMLLRLSEHIKHADAWPCDGEGDEHGNFVCKHRQTGGVTSPDYVMVPKADIAAVIDDLAVGCPKTAVKHLVRMLSAAPPSPRSDEGDGKAVLWSLEFTKEFGANPRTTFKTREEAEDYAAQCTKPAPRVIPLYAAPPSPPPSVEVGEMVEWLQHRSTVFVERGMIDHHKKLIKAASLLIALDAERGRMRTAVESAHGQFRDIRMLIPCDNYDETVRLIADRAVREMHRVLRSALPASDEKDST